MPNVRRLAALLSIGVIVSAACGGNNDDEIETSPTPFVPQDTAPAPTAVLQTQPEPVQPLDDQVTAVAGGLIEISVANTLFAANRWSMALGETATISVTNADTQQHNLRLAGLDGQYETDDDAITSPNAIGPGESGEVTFVPQVAGSNTFRCDFHPDSMGGQIEVE
jgi:FtsP/CotA-like multicopper oxidase with cupredoxin domain